MQSYSLCNNFASISTYITFSTTTYVLQVTQIIHTQTNRDAILRNFIDFFDLLQLMLRLMLYVINFRDTYHQATRYTCILFWTLSFSFFRMPGGILILAVLYLLSANAREPFSCHGDTCNRQASIITANSLFRCEFYCFNSFVLVDWVGVSLNIMSPSNLIIGFPLVCLTKQVSYIRAGFKCFLMILGIYALSDQVCQY